MLRWRLISAAVIVSLACFLMWADFQTASAIGREGLILAPLAILIALAGGKEVRELFESKGFRLRPLSCECGAGFVVMLACLPLLWTDYPPDCPIGRLGWVLFGIFGAVGGCFLVEIVRFQEPNQIIERVALQTLAAVYVGGLLSFLAILRDWHSNSWGLISLISAIAIVKLSDAAAYGVGKTIGKHKMSPKLSPGKTVEGAIGALVVGSLAGWLVLELLQWIVFRQFGAIPVWRCLVYGLCLSLAGMLGDLVESLLKRDAAIKDSSKWLPGLGGVLDVFDSLLVAGAVAYVCWSCGLLPLG